MSSTYVKEDIIISVHRRVLETFNAQEDRVLPFHNYRHTFEIVQKINDLSNACEASPSEMEIAVLAGWFIDIGYVLDYRSYKQAADDFVHSCLKDLAYDSFLIDLVAKTLNNFHDGQIPRTLPEKILSDAVFAIDMGKGFRRNLTLLRLERERKSGRQIDPIDWKRELIETLEGIKFYTDYAKIQYTPYLIDNIQYLDNQIRKGKALLTESEIDSLAHETAGKFVGLENQIPEKAIQTFFRSNYRNHINLSAIADNKANIMISVNAILISILISVLTYKELADQSPIIFMPSVIFIIAGISSLIFAVLAARPKITSIIGPDSSREEIENNIVFFGNFSKLSVEDYETAMDRMFKDGRLIYRNMTRDMYFLGKVLDKKYHFLRYSYTVFMMGLIFTVSIFLYLFFT